MARALTIVLLLGLLGLSLWAAYEMWITVVVDMPTWGWVMMIVGGGLSLLVGFGLMALMFYSSRHGYDDPARQIERDRP